MIQTLRIFDCFSSANIRLI